jgi:V/A-type H+/Na+-transporting ATPase subunit C
LLQATRYANVLAKIGAKRSNLLSESKIKTLTQVKSLSDFASSLNDTIYQERIAKIPVLESSRKFEHVFHESLIEDYIEIIKNSPKSVRIFLKIYVQRFEVENLKTIIKGIHAQLSVEEKKDRIYLQVEDFLRRRKLFEEGSEAAEIKELAETFKGTEYALPLKQGLSDYEENGTTACLDILVDKTFYEKLHHSFRQLPKKEHSFTAFYERVEETSYALLTLLRAKNLNYESNWLRAIIPEEILSVSKRTIEDLVGAPNFESALSIVLKSSFRSYFTKAQTPEETISTGEKAFRKALYIHAMRNRIFDVFNIGLPIAFMIQKEVEVRNLSSICLGIEAGMNSEKILGNLLFSS